MISSRTCAFVLLSASLLRPGPSEAAPAKPAPKKPVAAKTGAAFVCRPRYFVARAVDTAGRPLAKVRIRLDGSTDAGRNASFNTRTDASGLASLRLASGNYSLRDAVYDINYRGRNYRLPLYIVGEDNSDFDSRTGGIANLILKTSGLISKQKDAEDENSYFGGWFTLDARQSDGTVAYGFSDPNRFFVVTLTPVGALLDGKPGKTLTFTKPLSARREHRVIRDIPLGAYTVSVALKDANGSLTPLNVSTRENLSSASETPPALSAPLTFAPKDGDPTVLTLNGVMNTNLQIFLPPPA